MSSPPPHLPHDSTGPAGELGATCRIPAEANVSDLVNLREQRAAIDAVADIINGDNDDGVPLAQALASWAVTSSSGSAADKARGLARFSLPNGGAEIDIPRGALAGLASINVSVAEIAVGGLNTLSNFSVANIFPRGPGPGADPSQGAHHAGASGVSSAAFAPTIAAWEGMGSSGNYSMRHELAAPALSLAVTVGVEVGAGTWAPPSSSPLAPIINDTLTLNVTVPGLFVDLVTQIGLDASHLSALQVGQLTDFDEILNVLACLGATLDETRGMLSLPFAEISFDTVGVAAVGGALWSWESREGGEREREGARDRWYRIPASRKLTDSQRFPTLFDSTGGRSSGSNLDGLASLIQMAADTALAPEILGSALPYLLRGSTDTLSALLPLWKLPGFARAHCKHFDHGKLVPSSPPSPSPSSSSSSSSPSPSPSTAALTAKLLRGISTARALAKGNVAEALLGRSLLSGDYALAANNSNTDYVAWRNSTLVKDIGLLVNELLGVNGTSPIGYSINTAIRNAGFANLSTGSLLNLTMTEEELKGGECCYCCSSRCCSLLCAPYSRRCFPVNSNPRRTPRRSGQPLRDGHRLSRPSRSSCARARQRHRSARPRQREQW